MLHCQHSKGSVIANYQLVLKKEHTLEELTQIMKNYLEANSGRIGSFKVNAERKQFSGTLTSNQSFITT